MIFLDAGGFPWWAFLMMPVMMIGMGAMMWFMMRMMMDMGGHGSSHATDSGVSAMHEQASDSEVASLRQQVNELQQRLAAMEADRTQDSDDKPAAAASAEGEGRGHG